MQNQVEELIRAFTSKTTNDIDSLMELISVFLIPFPKYEREKCSLMELLVFYVLLTKLSGIALTLN